MHPHDLLGALDPLRNSRRNDPHAWARGIRTGSIPIRNKGTFYMEDEGVYCSSLKVEVVQDFDEEDRETLFAKAFYAFDDYSDSGGGHTSRTPLRALGAELAQTFYPRKAPTDDYVAFRLENFVRQRSVFQVDYVEPPPSTETVSIPTVLAYGLWRWLLQL